MDKYLELLQYLKAKPNNWETKQVLFDLFGENIVISAAYKDYDHITAAGDGYSLTQKGEHLLYQIEKDNEIKNNLKKISGDMNKDREIQKIVNEENRKNQKTIITISLLTLIATIVGIFVALG